MNIEKFIATRKALGFSQSALAKGICTQATLSRFENNGQIPTIKILIQLCNRLNLPLRDLFPTVGEQYSAEVAKMEQGEFFLITMEYEKLADVLGSLDVEQIHEPALLARYYYLKGFGQIFQQAPITEVLFTFDNLLIDEAQNVNELFRLLAYTGIGMVYSRDQQPAKAEFYFNEVFKKIYQYPLASREDVWRVLNILFHCGVFYSQRGDFETGDALLEYALEICSDNHVTYYLARVALQLAKNALAKGKNLQEVLELLEDARAFAKINRNTLGLAEIAQLKATVLQKIKKDPS